MEKRVVEDIKSFFESYEFAHKLTTSQRDRFLSVMIHTTQKDVVTIRVIEKIRDKNDNLICDARVEGNRITMQFKLVGQAKALEHRIREVVKPFYKVSFLGTTLRIVIANPSIRDVQETFMKLEKYCRRREDG
ncbi:hypothetical protein D3C81_544300 [compost metagenome]